MLCDSSDISFLFEDEDGNLDCPGTSYYGEQVFHMQYKDTVGKSFPWLYIDRDSLKEEARKHEYRTEIIVEGDHYDYLARITRI